MIVIPELTVTDLHKIWKDKKSCGDPCGCTWNFVAKVPRSEKWNTLLSSAGIYVACESWKIHCLDPRPGLGDYRKLFNADWILEPECLASLLAKTGGWCEPSLAQNGRVSADEEFLIKVWLFFVLFLSNGKLSCEGSSIRAPIESLGIKCNEC